MYFFGVTTGGEARCLGYLGFLQFVGLVAFIAQGIAVCLSFRLWRITGFISLHYFIIR